MFISSFYHIFYINNVRQRMTKLTLRHLRSVKKYKHVRLHYRLVLKHQRKKERKKERKNERTNEILDTVTCIQNVPLILIA